MASGPFSGEVEELSHRDVDVAVYNSIHHGQFGMLTFILEAFPSEIGYHLGGAAYCHVVSLDGPKPYIKRPLYVVSGMFAPYSGGTLYKSDEGLVCLDFDSSGQLERFLRIKEKLLFFF